MLPSFLTVLLWSFAIISANRSTRHIGAPAANLMRLCLAGVLLAAWAHLFGRGLQGQSLWFFVLSGCVGFGLGDIALFETVVILGPRLAVLLSQCLAAPIAAIIEWLWLGTTLTAAQIACSSVILTGVALALAPRDYPHLSRSQWIKGCLLGFVAALGQGGGAVLSRKAFQVAEATGLSIDGGTATYQRAIGGLGIVLAFFLILEWQARRNGNRTAAPRNWRRAWPWITAQALTGPTIGVSCFQWALATTPSGIVLPIVALTPLAVMPLAYFFEHDRPGARSLIGGAIAIAGAAALASVK